MRIAFFVPSFPATSETFILGQVIGLLDRGHVVDIFAYQPAPPGPVHDTVTQRDLARRVRLLPHRTDPGGWGAGKFPLSAARAATPCLRGEYAANLGGWRTLVRTLGRLAAEQPYDVVHCHYGHIGLRYRVAARYWRAPLVASFYGHDCSEYPRAHGASVFVPLFRDAAAVTSLSAHMDSRLLALGCAERQLRRIPLPVDADDFRPVARDRTRGEPVRILTVGRLAEKKGIEFGLRAIALLGRTADELRYDVVGDGPLRGHLEELATALGVGRIVRFHGARNSAEVRALMHDADIFLLPSVTAASGDEEGTPTVLIEAALCGLPVVSTLHAGIPELVIHGESGELVPERDSDALSDSLRRLLDNPDAWAAQGIAGRRHVQRHHARPVVAERLERLYMELTGTKTVPEQP